MKYTISYCYYAFYRVWHRLCSDRDRTQNLINARVMKTTKLILSIALVALATTSFAQHIFNIERVSPKQYHQIAHFSADKNPENNQIEIWMHDLQGRASKKVSWDVYEAPDVTRTLFVEQVEVIYEVVLGLESWMTAPFENDIAEEELFLESWMVAPFENTIVDEELILESWMTTPFEVAEVIELEEWMTAAWI